MHYSVYTSDQPVVRKRRRWIWWVLGISFVALVAWFAAGPILALRKIQEPSGDQSGSSLFGFLGKIVSGAQLKGEAEGRINILLLGVGGKNHPGGTLADTIQIVSINTKTKQVGVLSLPRDLRVTIPGVGTNKINYAHAYGELNPKTGGGPTVMKQVVSQILDLPIHYYVRLDFEGFEKIVDALGGVDITVEKAINDPFYPAPDMVRYDPFSISAGRHHLDGKTALKYVRSRETTNDFDRSRRQQQMLEAMKEKALTLGVLANPKKVSEIAGIVGDHVRTDFQTWEIAHMLELAAKDAQSYTVINRVIAAGAGEPLVSVNGGAYYLVPRTGNFKEIQMIAANIFTEPLIKEEAAKIEVVNASSKPTLLAEVTATLKNQGYTVANSRSIPTTISETILYDYSAGAKPNTAKFLGELLGIKATIQPRPTDSTVDFSVVIGTDYREE